MKAFKSKAIIQAVVLRSADELRTLANTILEIADKPEEGDTIELIIDATGGAANDMVILLEIANKEAIKKRMAEEANDDDLYDGQY